MLGCIVNLMILIIHIILLEFFLLLQQMLVKVNKFLKVIVILNMIRSKGMLDWLLLLVLYVNVKDVNVNLVNLNRIQLIIIFIFRYFLIGLKNMKIDSFYRTFLYCDNNNINIF